MHEIGVTKMDLARALGHGTEGAVRHYLSGVRSMNVEQLQIVAECLKWTVAQLLGEVKSIEYVPVPVPMPAPVPVEKPKPAAVEKPKPEVRPKPAPTTPGLNDFGTIVLSHDELDVILRLYRPAPEAVKPVAKRLFAKMIKELSKDVKTHA